MGLAPAAWTTKRLSLSSNNILTVSLARKLSFPGKEASLRFEVLNSFARSLHFKRSMQNQVSVLKMICRQTAYSWTRSGLRFSKKIAFLLA